MDQQLFASWIFYIVAKQIFFIIYQINYKQHLMFFFFFIKNIKRFFFFTFVIKTLAQLWTLLKWKKKTTYLDSIYHSEYT